MNYLVRISMLALAVFSARPVLAANPPQTPPSAQSKPAELKPEEQSEAAALFSRAVAQVSGSLQRAATSVQDGSARDRATKVAVQIQKDVAAFDRDFMKMTASQRLWILDQMIVAVGAYHQTSSADREGVLMIPMAIVMAGAFTLMMGFVMGGIPHSTIDSIIRVGAWTLGLTGVVVGLNMAFFDQLPALKRNLEGIRAATAKEVALQELN